MQKELHKKWREEVIVGSGEWAVSSKHKTAKQLNHQTLKHDHRGSTTNRRQLD